MPEESIKGIRTRKGLAAFGVILLILSVSAAFFSYYGFGMDTASVTRRLFPTEIFMAGGVLVLIVLGYLFEGIYNAKTIFFNSFAKEKGYIFSLKKGSRVQGLFFPDGEISIDDVMEGKMGGYESTFFNYDIVVGEVRISKSVLSISLGIDIPKILFLSDPYLRDNYQSRYFQGDLSAISLDGSREGYTLVTEKGMEMETLQIFSQEFQLLLKDEYKGLSLDFGNKKVSVYSEGISDRQSLIRMFSLAEDIVSHIVPLLAGISRDYMEIERLRSRDR